MAAVGGEIARGLGSAAVFAYEDGEPGATKVDIPGIMTLEASADATTDELKAANTIIAVASDVPRGTGSMTWGRMSFGALVVVNGGEVEALGTGAAEIARHTLPATPITNEFKLVVQTDSLDVAGAGYRIILPRCKAGPASETLDQEAWNTPSFELQYLGDADGALIIREQFEAMVAIGTAYPSP